MGQNDTQHNQCNFSQHNMRARNIEKIHKYLQCTGHYVKYQLSIAQPSILLCWSFCATQMMYDIWDITVFAPLLIDLKTLEEVGVNIGKLGHSLKGTVYSAVADNLTAHGLILLCHSERNAVIRCSNQWTKGQKFSWFKKYRQTKQRKIMVLSRFVLSDQLSFFHPITGFPPDILYNLFEGVVPVELAHCWKDLISKKYFTLEELNKVILWFPDQHSDRVDRPHLGSQNFASQGTIGGNGSIFSHWKRYLFPYANSLFPPSALSLPSRTSAEGYPNMSLVLLKAFSC